MYVLCYFFFLKICVRINEWVCLVRSFCFDSIVSRWRWKKSFVFLDQLNQHLLSPKIFLDWSEKSHSTGIFRRASVVQCECSLLVGSSLQFAKPFPHRKYRYIHIGQPRPADSRLQDKCNKKETLAQSEYRNTELVQLTTRKNTNWK